MKGLLISIVVFAGYVVSTAVLSHVFRVKRHSKLFFPAVAAWTPVYFLAYFLAPADAYVLPESWLCRITWLDAAYGCIVFLLNAHSYIDFFFGFNGGFSMSLMFEVLKKKQAGATSEDLIRRYTAADGTDKIYGWRLPRLEETGYVTIDRAAGTCRLAPKGVPVARLTWFLKRFLNLGAGG